MGTKIYFPKIEKHEKLDKKIGIRVSTDQFQKIKLVCEKYHIRKNDLIRYLLTNFLKHSKLVTDGTGNKAN